MARAPLSGARAAAGAAASEQSAPATPDRRVRRARRRPHRLGGLRRGRAHHPACCRPGRSSIRASGSCRSRISPGAIRVITFDGRGNGRSDRPTDPAAYGEAEFAADALAVLDATGDGARGRRRRCRWARSASLVLAADHPERVAGLVFIAPVRRPAPASARAGRRSGVRGAARHGRRLGQVQPPLLAARLRPTSSSSSSPRCFTEPHSTKPIEDTVGWGLETDAETLVATTRRRLGSGRGASVAGALCAAIRCPVLVIHGNDDARRPGARCTARRWPSSRRVAWSRSRAPATSPTPATRSWSTC